MTNDTCIKSFIATQAYKVVSTHAHEIPGWKILSIPLHSCSPNLGGTNGHVQYGLATLTFNNREEPEDLHSRIIRLQQEIILSGETISPTRILFRYMKSLSYSNKTKAFIAPKIIDIITFIDNNGKSAVYKGGNIDGIYRYLDMIEYPKSLTPSVQRSCNFGPSSFIKNDTASIQPVIADLHMIQKSICKFCGRIGHKADDCIIHCPKLLPPSLIRKINQFTALHGEETNEPPREWNSQPTEDQFKSRTSPPKTSPAVSYIMGILNHNAIDNGDVEVHPSEFPV